MSLLPPQPQFGPLSGRALQQDAARLSGRNGEPGPATLVNRRPQDGPREFLNFLTWPFFLAQLLAANELLAKTNANPVAEEPSEAERAAEAASRAAPDADPANLSGMMNGDREESVAAEPDPSGTTEDWFAELDEPRSISDGDAPDLVVDDPEPGRPTSFGGGGGGSGNSGQGEQQSAAQPPLPPSGDDVAAPIAGAGGALDSVGDSVITVTAPVLDTTAEVVGGVVEATLPVVGGIVASVTQPVAPVLDGVAEITSGVIEPVAGLAQSAAAVVEPVLDLAGDLLADTTQSITPVIQPVVATVAEAVESVTEAIAAPDLAETLAPVTTPVVTVLEDALRLGDHQSDLGSGGMLSFVDPPAPPVTDVLFAAGKYTDYGIALSGMPDVPDAPATTPDLAAQDHPQDAAADDAAPAGDTPATTLLAIGQSPPSLIDEIGLRSSDGLL